MLNIAKKAAHSAGEIIIRAIDRLEYLEVVEKSPNDFATEIDRQAEKEIIFHIKKAYPEHHILSEESGEHFGAEPDYRWIIDPIDGTANYMRGLPHFCISIALEVKGRIELGIIFDPLRDEMFSASRGRGAQLNNHRIRVSKTTKIERAFLATGLPQHKRKNLELIQQSFDKLSAEASNIRLMGSAALDLAYVAAGRLDGYWESDLHPWDIAAGVLLVKEAGGFVTDKEGKDDYMETGEIIAATPKIYPYIYKSLN